MTAPSSIDPVSFLHDQLASASPDLLRSMLTTFVNTLMSAEADAICGAPYGMPSPDRVNVRNGYRQRDFDTRAGTLEVAIPKLRSGSYFPDWLLERRRLAEAALTSVVATCYLLGVSTRRMEKLVGSLGITRLSRSQVSEMARDLDAQVEAFRTRPLDAGPYTFVAADALVLKVREGGRVVNVHALLATGVNADGHREILGLQVTSAEDGAGWLGFFRDLACRRRLTVLTTRRCAGSSGTTSGETRPSTNRANRASIASNAPSCSNRYSVDQSPGLRNTCCSICPRKPVAAPLISQPNGSPPRPTCSWPSMAARCRPTRWSVSRGGRRAGRPAFRLAAISMDSHPDPDQFVKELITEDSALTGYLVEEVLSTQPPEVREVLLATSILEQVSAEAASALTGDERAGAILSAVAHANAFVQPAGGGWYRYQTLFAEVLRLKLRHEHPGRITALHRRAARWYGRNGSLTDAVRHAAQAGDWPLAAGMVIEGLAISEIIEPRGGRSLAAEFVAMPHSDAWTAPHPYLVSAAAALAAGRPESAAAALDAADGILERQAAGQETAVRLAAAMIRLAAARRTGDLPAAAAAASSAEALVSRVPGGRPARHRQIQARVLADCAAVELWSGHLDEAARVLEPALAAAAAPGGEHERAGCLGQLALVEALRGRLRRAVKLATEATAVAADEQQPPAQYQAPAALAALAWAHLERGELREARGRLRQVDAALGVSPDKLIGALACLMVACAGLAEGRGDVATQFVARARSGWSVPAWLGQRLSLAESRAYVAAGDTRAALAAAGRAGRNAPLAAAVALAHARAAAGDGVNAQRALAPALAAGGEAPDRVRLQAWLVDARLSYGSGDGARGRRSLTSALRLAEREQLRLPFVLERGWIGPLLRRDPELARTHRRLLGPSLISPGLAPASQATAAQVAPVSVEQLSEREREVLRYMSRMLTAAETASELYISINTVKSHLKNIYRKLQAPHCRGAVRRARQLGLI